MAVPAQPGVSQASPSSLRCLQALRRAQAAMDCLSRGATPSEKNRCRGVLPRQRQKAAVGALHKTRIVRPAGQLLQVGESYHWPTHLCSRRPSRRRMRCRYSPARPFTAKWQARRRPAAHTQTSERLRIQPRYCPRCHLPPASCICPLARKVDAMVVRTNKLGVLQVLYARSCRVLSWLRLVGERRLQLKHVGRWHWPREGRLHAAIMPPARVACLTQSRLHLVPSLFERQRGNAPFPIPLVFGGLLTEAASLGRSSKSLARETITSLLGHFPSARASGDRQALTIFRKGTGRDSTPGAGTTGMEALVRLGAAQG